MRILHVCEVDFGGAAVLVREFSGAQAADGDDVLVLAPAGFPADDGVEVAPWDLERGRPATYPRAVRRLRDVVRRFRPDVVHLHSFVAGFVGRLPGAVAGVPVVYQPHAWSFDLREERAFGHAVRAWERFAGRRSTVLVTNCRDEVDEGRRAGVRTPAVSIGVPIDPARFYPVTPAERESHRERCGLTRPRTLVCVARLARQKGQDQLVAAWERRPLPDTELVLVGPGDTGDLAAAAPREWGRTIRAVGDQDDVRPWVWAADALVLPSRYETVALVVAEAMSCARPVVATAVNGVTEVVREGRWPAAGLVVALGAMDELLDAAREVLDDPGAAEAMAVAGRARAGELFDPPTVLERLQGAYATACGTPTRGDRG